MRKYQPIWEQLKQHGSCTVAADSTFHKRIRQAVIKEKYRDVTYKVECDRNNICKILHYASIGNSVHFSLRTFYRDGKTSLNIDI